MFLIFFIAINFITAFFWKTINENIIGSNINNVSYYLSNLDAINQENEINNTTDYQIYDNLKTIFIRVENDACFQVSFFNLIIKNCLPIPISTGFSPNNDGINDEFDYN